MRTKDSAAELGRAPTLSVTPALCRAGWPSSQNCGPAENVSKPVHCAGV